MWTESVKPITSLKWSNLVSRNSSAVASMRRRFHSERFQKTQGRVPTVPEREAKPLNPGHPPNRQRLLSDYAAVGGDLGGNLCVRTIAPTATITKRSTK